MVNLTPLGALVSQLPLFLVWLAGIGLALLHWRRKPRAAPLALTAFIVLITLQLVGRYLDGLLPGLLTGAGVTGGNPGLALTLNACCQAGIAAAAWVMILTALFGGSRAGKQENP